MKAHPVGGTGEKAKDPIFGLAMGGASQASADLFRWINGSLFGVTVNKKLKSLNPGT